MASQQTDEHEEWKSGGDDSEVEVNEDSESDFDLEEEEDEDDGDESDEETSFRLSGGKSILWLCQEGQIPLARKRFEWLRRNQQQQSASSSHRKGSDRNIDDGDNDECFAKQLEKEVFQVGRDKNYALQELLMGGTSDRNAHQLTLQMLDFSQHYPQQQGRMLSAQPPSHQRTALHWAAWGNADLSILQRLVKGYPEALVVRDKKDHGHRTPLEILKRYFSDLRSNINAATAAGHSHNPDSPPQPRIAYLERCTKSWTRHRLRQEVHKCVLRYFAPHPRQLVHGSSSSSSPLGLQQHSPSEAESMSMMLTPFDKVHRKQRANIKSTKAWFVLSVLGSLVQREMKPLALHILGYVGKDAKVASQRRRQQKKKRKRAAQKQNPTNKVAR